MKYKVRDQFVLKIGKDVFKGGDVVELNDQQAEDFANIIEPAEKPAAPRKAKAEE